MDRAELLSKIRTSRELLDAALARFPSDQITEPALVGGWSVKDMLVHLGWWALRASDIYGSLSRGGTPRVVIGADDLDKVNRRVLDEYNERSLEEARAMEAQAYRALLTIVETAPEADLFNGHRFHWTAGQPFVNWVIWNTYEHYEEHLKTLEKRLAELAQDPAVAGGLAYLEPAVQRAGEFLAAHGRDIEKALFDCTFNGASPAEALEVLARYQNPDGGFAGLEVDIKAPQSNPFATEMALSVMRWLALPRDHPLLLRTLGYLETTQLDDGTWRFTPEIYQYWLAPWFQGWQWPNLNPSCTISGLLKQLGVGSDRLHNRVRALFDRIAKPEDLLGSEFYSVKPYAGYFLTGWDFPQSDLYRWGVVWWMLRSQSTLDAAHWLDLAPMPRCSIAQRLPDAVIKARLDQLAAEQAQDGGWPTPYDPAWRGWTTVTSLLILRAYGRADTAR